MLEIVGHFIYKTKLAENLFEHEYDYVFIGTFNEVPLINHDEVDDWKYIDLKSLRKDIAENPAHYTYWFKLIVTHPQLTAVIA